MKMARIFSIVILALVIGLGTPVTPDAGEIWIKCHITCRCALDNTVGNFSFNIPVDTSPDIGFDADLACKRYGYHVCYDGCNGLKFTYTYQVVAP
ncbi:MAG: hypothetical protein AB7V04_03010 [Desulfomonilaceae bacterium]